MILKSSAKTQYEKAVADLKTKRDTLLARLRDGRATRFLSRHAKLFDDYFLQRFEQSAIGPRMSLIKNPYAIVALGGYGRQEQCVQSDIDLLILFNKQIPAEAEDLIREIVYPLWDLGFEVGHATRSIKECIQLAADDYEVLTSLLDARFVCGQSFLYSDMMRQLRDKILKRHTNRVINWLVESNRQRHVKFGDSTYRLEPSLKEGQGGLRDYHTILWICRVTMDLKQTRDLEYYGRLSHQEYATLQTALNFVWNVRNRLHDLTGRKCDQLHFEHQIKLAEQLGYKGDNGQQPVEVFLGELHGQMDYIKQQHLMFLYAEGYAQKQKRKPLRFRRPGSGRQSKIEGLEVFEGMLRFTSPEAVLQAPLLLIRIFEESARLKMPLSPEAKRLQADLTHLVDEQFINRADVVRSFERILRTPAPTFNVLSEMLNSGFLVQFIPPFKSVVNRIQYDEYHLFPVDRHLLRTVQTIKMFGSKEDPTRDDLCGDIYQELRNKKLLLWAALLHDIGKSDTAGGHSRRGATVAADILRAKGYGPKAVATVVFLIETHLLMSKTAARRDINDEETAIAVAREVKDPERLKMLYLLSVADAMATGPMAYTDWSLALLRDLFFKVLKIITSDELASREAVAAMATKKDTVLAAARQNDTEALAAELYTYMGPRYLLFAGAEDILSHIALYRQMADRPFVWTIAKTAEADTRLVTVCAKDRPGLFSQISGVLTLNGVNILDAQIFTWRNNIALDVFRVTPPPDRLREDERWQRAEKHLEHVLAGKLDLQIALKEKMSVYRRRKPRGTVRPHRIVVDNSASSFFSIVEVFTYDFAGLLYGLTHALHDCGLDIWVAKIATKIEQVVDVFYVRDFDGQKVDDKDQVMAIQAAIAEVLPGSSLTAVSK